MDSRPQDWAHQTQNLKGKRILISGGTTGIGRATARLLVSLGADVMIYGRDEQALQEALKDIQAIAKGKVVGVAADQSDSMQIEKVFNEFDNQLGPIDILVNNAAQPAESVTDMPIEKIEFVLKSNLLGYMACAKQAIERMKDRGGGHIVNVGSMSAEVRDTGADVYVATKSAIQGWSESLRKTVFEQGIRVSLLELGMVDTNLHGEPVDSKRAKEKLNQQKTLTSEDVAEAIYYCMIQPPRCDVLSIQLSPHMQGL